MRKLLSIICFIILALVLTACIPQEEEARLFQEQYDQYLLHDIADDAYFDQMINTLSNDIIPSIVVVNVIGKNNLGQVKDITIGTGFIYALYTTSAKVITSSQLIHQTHSFYNYSYEIIDFTNQSYTAEIIEDDQTLGLTTLSFNVNVADAKLRKLNLATYEPRINEPILMIANYQRSRNSMHLGLLEDKDAETSVYRSSLTVDSHCLGGTILNMQQEVMSLVIGIEGIYPILINLEDIKLFLTNI